MATFIQEQMPKMLPDDSAGSIKKLYKYVETLNEQLAYIFSNLGGDNFNSQDMGDSIANLGAVNIVTQTIISNSVVTKSLYAERGDVAQLTVDWLSTSKKVMKYLNNDTSDDNYIEAHEQGIELKTASVAMNGNIPVTERLYDRYSNAMYWQKDIAYAEIIDGFPYVNGKQVYMDTEVTEYPVHVYAYNVTVNMRIDFDSVGDTSVPKIKFGDGDAGTAEVFNDGNGLLLNYHKSTDGSLQQIKLTDDGVFINGVDVSAGSTDGVSPTVDVTDIDGGHRLTITDVNGEKTVEVMDGADGVGIADIFPVNVTDESGEANIYDIYLDNGDVYEINVWNGKKGDKGDTPVKGTDYWTEADKEEIAEEVLAGFPDGDILMYGDEVSY